MPLPNLIHPVPVVVERIDKENTTYREHANEPVRVASRKANITLEAQVSWGAASDPKPAEGGIIEEYDGYLLFRYIDLQAAGVEIKRGDKIIKIGWQTYENLFVVRLKPMGHYPDQNGTSLVRAYFKDRVG